MLGYTNERVLSAVERGLKIRYTPQRTDGEAPAVSAALDCAAALRSWSCTSAGQQAEEMTGRSSRGGTMSELTLIDNGSRIAVHTCDRDMPKVWDQE